MQLKGKLIEFCKGCCDSSEVCIELSADTCGGNQRTLTETAVRTRGSSASNLFTYLVW